MAVVVELPAASGAVLDEPQAVRATVKTAAAAGRNVDRRNISELSKVVDGVDAKDGQVNPLASAPAGPLNEANRVLILVVNIRMAVYAADMGSPATSREPREYQRLNRGAMRVLALLDGHDRPVAAQDLWTQMRAAGDLTGLATVYRALHALAGVGLLHTFHHDTETTYRACGPAPHDHLICRTCGRVQERRTSDPDHQLSQLSQDGFTAEDCLLQIYGRCNTCPEDHHRAPPMECASRAAPADVRVRY